MQSQKKKNVMLSTRKKKFLLKGIQRRAGAQTLIKKKLFVRWEMANQTSGLSSETEEYFDSLSKGIAENYKVAEAARAKGLDPVDKVEVPLALTMAAKVVKLAATLYPQLDKEEIIERILELESEYGSLDNSVSFKIAEEIAQEKYCKFENQLEAIDAGIRVGFAYTTLGVVSSPIEGYTEIKTARTRIGET